jgi:hypothetical protein
MFRRRLLSLAVLVLPTILVSKGAEAQTISAGGEPYPTRLVNGTNEGTSTRPQNLNPLGVSYADCMDDMTLQFSVTLAGFNGNDSAEVWASLSSDCTSSTDRGIGSTAVPCWGTRSGNIFNPTISNPQTYTFNVRVQDLVGWQQTPPTFAQAADPPAQGPSACSAQATFAAVPININFLAIDSSGNSDGTPYQYTILTDLVGPPEPSGLALEPGNGALLPSWAPNTDTDTVGYDVFLAPPAGQPAQGHGCPAIPGASDGGTHGAGGISNISAEYLVGGGGEGVTAIGESIGDYTITGLTDETAYSVAVAAVDGTGNVGPASSSMCATPLADAGTFDAALEDDAGTLDAAVHVDAGVVDAAQSESPETEKAGCLCSQGVPASPADAPPAAMAAGAIAIALGRRRRVRGR